mmetsp:Transcript_4632/g.6853  ORF Transcript_4632/g.6853 Transcript_4632/m.6853 type:complete len:301 (-) Transcript_4632:197-1099(-)
MVASPTWSLDNSGSFASIHAVLPPFSAIDCESDAVVTFSGDLDIKGCMSGGFLASLARRLFTNESFFTTKVENNQESQGSVMMAPADPGGVILHRLVGNYGDDLLLTRGAYVASDGSVQISSEIQRGFGRSMLSGTGFFLLRASGRGTVACAAYGAIHTFTLNSGEVRAVDNGHLVAWSASTKYRVGLASGGSRGGIVNSVTSGEGLMCFFEGPGTIYIQSHKPAQEADTVIKSTKAGANNSLRAGSSFAVVIFVMIFIFFIGAFFVMAFVMANQQGGQSNFDDSRSNQYRSNYGGRVEF